MLAKKFRDLTLINLNTEEQLVVACDSCGGIGSKTKDVVKVPPYVVGRYISRVPLLEVICSGATPISVINTLAVEMEPTGKEIIRGIIDELSALKLDEGQLINGSTEDNITTVQTALGITVIGKLSQNRSRLGRSQKGDQIFLVGLPKMGHEVTLEDSEVTDLKSVLALLKTDGIREILPVGSKGVEYEAKLLASLVNCKMKFADGLKVDLKKSAGPATCLVVSATAEIWTEKSLSEKIAKPVKLIGKLISY